MTTPTAIFQHLQELQCDGKERGEEIEVEVRLGKCLPGKGTFNAGVDAAFFYDMMAAVREATAELKSEQEPTRETLYYYQDNVRRVVQPDHNVDYFERVTPLYKAAIPYPSSYDLRVSAKTETRLSQVPGDLQLQGKRNKTRRRFIFPKGFFIDFNQVVLEKNGEVTESFEVELELTADCPLTPEERFLQSTCLLGTGPLVSKAKGGGGGKKSTTTNSCSTKTAQSAGKRKR